MQVPQPICLINISAKLCLVIKKNTSCHQHDSAHISGWLIEAAWGASPFYTHLKIAVISICLLLPGCVPPHCSHYRLAHKTSVSSRKGCHHWSNILWWPPFWVYSNICHPAPAPPNCSMIPLTLREIACRVIVSDLSCFNFPLPLLCSSPPLLLLNKCFKLLGDSLKNQPTMPFWRKH